MNADGGVEKPSERQLQTLNQLNRAIALVNGQRRLARLIGTSQARVWNWMRRDQEVPIEVCPYIEVATAGAVRCHDLRPDFFDASGRPRMVDIARDMESRLGAGAASEAGKV